MSALYIGKSDWVQCAFCVFEVEAPSDLIRLNECSNECVYMCEIMRYDDTKVIKVFGDTNYGSTYESAVAAVGCFAEGLCG